MIEATSLAAEIVVRATLLAVIATLAFLIMARRFPRTSQRIGRIACIALLGLPLLLLAVPRVDLAPSLLRVTEPAFQPAEATQRFEATSPPVAAPWNDVRYKRANPVLFMLIVGVYGAGLLLVGTRLVRSALKVRTISRSCTPLNDPRVLAIARDLRNRRTLPIVTHPDCLAPLTLGALNPVIVLPEVAVGWPEPKLAASLAHEAAHVRNHDPFWIFAAYLATALYWFHPGVWLLRRQMRITAERASDDAAIRIIGDANSYATSLLEFAVEARTRHNPLACSLASSIAQSPIALRIQRILDRSDEIVTAPRPGIRAAPILGLAVILVATCVKVSDFRTIRPLKHSPLATPLLAALESDDAQARADALFRLSRWQGREAQVLPLLLTHLGDPALIGDMPRWDFASEGWGPAWPTFENPSPGEVAALGLASMGRVAASSLARALTNPDPVVRRNAAWALGELRHPRGISSKDAAALAATLNDTDPRVRAAAVWSVGDIALVRYLPEVRSMVRHETDLRAKQAAQSTLAALEAGHSLEFIRITRDAS